MLMTKVPVINVVFAYEGGTAVRQVASLLHSSRVPEFGLRSVCTLTCSPGGFLGRCICDVFLPHSQYSQDSFWIQLILVQDKVLTECINECIRYTFLAVFSSRSILTHSFKV